MLNPPSDSRGLVRWRGPCRGLPALVLGAGLIASGLSVPAGAAPAAAAVPRPVDLVILMRSESVQGEKQVGVYGIKADPRGSGLWSVQVWEETDGRVVIATDRIGCSTTAPMRITGSGGRLLVRQLNPGGAIHLANRLDHLIWWAVCQPSFAGRDPSTLGPEARRLGYSGQLQEEQQVLRAPGPPRS
ncbi:MAG: hypothetical protein ACKO0M_12140 [Cyanobium sp.]